MVSSSLRPGARVIHRPPSAAPVPVYSGKADIHSCSLCSRPLSCYCYALPALSNPPCWVCLLEPSQANTACRSVQSETALLAERLPTGWLTHLSNACTSLARASHFSQFPAPILGAVKRDCAACHACQASRTANRTQFLHLAQVLLVNERRRRLYPHGATSAPSIQDMYNLLARLLAFPDRVTRRCCKQQCRRHGRTALSHHQIMPRRSGTVWIFGSPCKAC